MYMNMSYQYLFVCVPLDKGNDPLRYIFDQLLNKASNTITNENHIGRQIDIFCFFTRISKHLINDDCLI